MVNFEFILQKFKVTHQFYEIGKDVLKLMLWYLVDGFILHKNGIQTTKNGRYSNKIHKFCQLKGTAFLSLNITSLT